MDCSPPGSSVHRISQARILEWVAIPVAITGVGSILQGICPTQGLNSFLLSLLLWQADSLPLEPPGKAHLIPEHCKKLSYMSCLVSQCI